MISVLILISATRTRVQENAHDGEKADKQKKEEGELEDNTMII